MDKPLRIKYETPDDLVVRPDELDIMEFQVLISDWTFWKARCDLAAQLNTDVGTLEALVWANILSNAGLWDPKTPKDLPTRVLVKVRDLQDSAKAMQFGPNSALQAGLVTKNEPSSDPFEDDFDDR